MQAKEAAKMLGGSITIYVIMAACSAANGPPAGLTSQDGSVSSGGGSGSGGASSGVSSSGSDGETSSGGSDGSGRGGDGPSILDALTDPVPHAMADVNGSGTRLKAKYYAGTDGSQQFAGMHDSTLNVDCGFQTASDGTTRCLPSGASIGNGTNYSVTFYADSSCTQPLSFASCTATPSPTYAQKTVTTGTGCQASTVTDVYPVGVQFTGTIYSNTLSPTYVMTDAGAYVYTDAGALEMTWPCSVAPATYTTLYAFYPVDAEVPASSFVQATIQTQP